MRVERVAETSTEHDGGVEILTAELPPCHRCRGPLLLLARVPRRLDPSSRRVAGTRGIGLCPACDRHDNTAAGVLAYFTLHREISDDTMATASTLIHQWARRVADQTPTTEQMQNCTTKEHHRWLAGEL